GDVPSAPHPVPRPRDHRRSGAPRGDGRAPGRRHQAPPGALHAHRPRRRGLIAATMARPTAMDEHFVHQIPELLPNVVTRNPYWRESYFFELHRPDAAGDVVFFTMAHHPAREHM